LVSTPEEGSVPDAFEASGTILLVEDDSAVRAVARRALLRFGFNVLPAAGGEEALQVANEHNGEIDLLLTDVMMPGMNGVEVAKRIQRLRPGIRVFYMSGYADQDLVGQGLLQPGTHFLQKPFTPQELGGRVRDVLSNSSDD
jgi:two-component system cell cycle sensor histidine kinase/response regulator CckA